MLAESFHAGLRDHGHPDQRVDDRWTGADRERTRLLATELVAAQPQVIFAYLSAQLTAVAALTKQIPIVFVGASNPVRFVRGDLFGGNITGFTLYEAPLGPVALPKEALFRASGTSRSCPIRAPRSAARTSTPSSAPPRPRSGSSRWCKIGGGRDRVRDRRVARQGDGGLIVAPGTFSEANGDHLQVLTTSPWVPRGLRDPACFAYRGGLMSYGPDPVETVRRAAAYVGRILRGENPATLPVQAPTKFDFIVNLKTARSMGVTISSALLAQADEIVEDGAAPDSLPAGRDSAAALVPPAWPVAFVGLVTSCCSSTAPST